MKILGMSGSSSDVKSAPELLEALRRVAGVESATLDAVSAVAVIHGSFAVASLEQAVMACGYKPGETRVAAETTHELSVEVRGWRGFYGSEPSSRQLLLRPLLSSIASLSRRACGA